MRNIIKKLGFFAIIAVFCSGVFGVSSSNAGYLPYGIDTIESFLVDATYFNGYAPILDNTTFHGMWKYTAIAWEAGGNNITEENTVGPTTFSTFNLSNWGSWASVNLSTSNIYFSDTDGPYPPENLAFNPFVPGGDQLKLFQLTADSNTLSYLANPLTLSKGTYIVGFNDDMGHTDKDYDDLIIAITPVPEPATLLLLGSGLIGILGFRRKFRK